jgi:hypothetical protein
MEGIVKIALMAATTLAVAATPANAASKYKLDAQQNQVVELSNLSDGAGCLPYRPTDRLVGKVVKRHGPAEMPLWITGVTVESVDGLLMSVNINIKQAMADLSIEDGTWVYGGINTLLEVGKKVHIEFYRCGAAGEVPVIHSIRRAAKATTLEKDMMVASTLFAIGIVCIPDDRDSIQEADQLLTEWIHRVGKLAEEMFTRESKKRQAEVKSIGTHAWCQAHLGKGRM